MSSAILSRILPPLLFLLSSVLAAVAWYRTSKYRLPLPFPALPALSTFLPLVELITTFYTANRVLSPAGSRKNPLPPLLVLLNLFLLLLPTALVPSAVPALFPENLCQLEQTWKGWYSEKNVLAIKGVQDALTCCGFRTNKNMAFPFFKNGEGGGGVPADTCARALGGGDPSKVSACLPLWEDKMKTTVWLLIAAAALVVTLKLAFLSTALGDPEMVRRWFNPPAYEGYNGRREIEEIDDEDDDGLIDARDSIQESDLVRGGRGEANRDREDSRTRLLLPQENGRARSVGAEEEVAWRS
ncbi:hypothetical protein DRE_03221 [Drechslerella stenobrocha 248]|uniref:Tetraspanin Tsp3 n=1 Tax=Drechslerella stenobrocha 248 TaxID=1043628 RepID=W7HTW7_9PEZI|nr:hypothetical protein DRE_03221 [Drechslerella stenobrocha 248]